MGAVTLLATFVRAGGNNSTAVPGNPLQPYATIQAAMTALYNSGDGGDIFIGNGDFASPTTTYDRIQLVGSGRPRYNWTVQQLTLSDRTYSTPTKLVGGTVIKGNLTFLSKHNVSVCNLGIDCGSDYVTNGGAESDGLQIRRNSGITDDNNTSFPTGGYPLVQGINVENVTILLKSSDSLFHGALLEGIDSLQVNGLSIWGGVHGLAVKAVDAQLRNIRAYENDYNNIIIKSNNYAPCGSVLLDGFVCTGPGNGVIVQNKSTSTTLDDITIKNGVARGVTKTVKTIVDNGQGFNRLSLHSIKGNAAFEIANDTNTSVIDCWNGNTAYGPSGGGLTLTEVRDDIKNGFEMETDASVSKIIKLITDENGNETLAVI